MMNNSHYDTVIEIVCEVSSVLHEQFGRVEPFKTKSHSPTDVVTTLDLQVERELAARLKLAYPQIGFAGEEYGGSHEGERFWLADPIDGTAHFVRGIPFCTSMLALIERNEVVFSTIYDFVREDMYIAEKGSGAWRNGERLQVSNRPLRSAYLGFESALENHPEHVASYLELRRQCTIVETINCGFEYALVAQGKLEGRLCLSAYGHDWDYAPGSLLVAEAGGVVADLGKSSYDYRSTSFLATNQAVYVDLTTGKDALFPVLS